MKIKNLLLLSSMLLFAFSLSAQYIHPLAVEKQYPGDSLAAKVYESAVIAQNDPTTTAVRTTWVSNRPKDNWFISLNGGIAQLMSEETRYMDFKDQIKPTAGLAVGKWLSPVLGVRFSVTGAELKGFATWNDVGEGITTGGAGLGSWYLGKNYTGVRPWENSKLNTNNYQHAWKSIESPNVEGRALIYNRFLKEGDYITTHEGPGYTYDFTYTAASFDLLINLKNLTMPYNYQGFFNPIFYAGIGFSHTYKDGDRSAVNGIMEKLGLQLNFRLSDQWDLSYDTQFLILPEFFDRRVGDGNTHDIVGNYTLGLTYRFNFRHFIKAPFNDQSEIDRLNEEINRLRARPDCPPVVICPECPELIIDTLKVPVVKENLKFLPTPVFFLVNSSVVRDNQWMSITKAAEYLNENPGKKLKLTGYADKQTGTVSINKRLSEQRAKAVADVLVNRFGISRDRLELTYLGDTFQPFAENDWNRAVVFIIPD